MEEILASIRKIISEDQPEAAPAAKPAPAAAPPAAPMAAVVEEEILTLTEEVKEEAPPAAEPPPPPSRAFEDDVAFAAVEEPAPEADEDLISESTRDKVERVFDTLEEEEAPAPAPMPMPAPSGSGVEAVFTRAVKEAFAPTLQNWVGGHQAEIMDQLKPLIRAWMDEHLPPLIEAAVKKEISRAARSRKR